MPVLVLSTYRRSEVTYLILVTLQNGPSPERFYSLAPRVTGKPVPLSEVSVGLRSPFLYDHLRHLSPEVAC